MAYLRNPLYLSRAIFSILLVFRNYGTWKTFDLLLACASPVFLFLILRLTIASVSLLHLCGSSVLLSESLFGGARARGSNFVLACKVLN